jgi:phosphomannomutase
MSNLMMSVSGIRGMFGSALNPINAMNFAAQFGLFQKSRYLKNQDEKINIIIGRDSRTTGDTIAHAVISGLLSVGVDVVYLGIVSTPTLLLAVEESDACGGMCITASHNPAEWNAIKFVDKEGMFLIPEVMNQYLAMIDNTIEYVDWNKIGKKTEDYEASWRHINKILNIPYLDIDKIRQTKFKVVLNSVNGAGGVISPILLAELGCELIEINSEPHGYFAHTPEPLSKNLKQIEEAVKQHKADIGFATDPDVDRLAIIDETGNCIGEEFSLLLSEKFILSTLQKNNIKLNDIVTNLSSSMASEDIANEYGINVIRTKVGEINVGNTMKAIKSPVGGEGNGGIICPDVHYTRDAIAGMALILAYMAQTNKKISTLCNQIPHYYFAKSKIETNKDLLDNIMKKAEIAFLDNNNFDVVKIDKTDGIKIILTKAWIHIRKSGTEPIIRVYVEAESTEKAEQLCSDAKTLLTN